MAKVYFADNKSTYIPYGTTVEVPDSMIDYEYDHVYRRAAPFIESVLKAKGIDYYYRTAFHSTGDWLTYWEPF